MNHFTFNGHSTGDFGLLVTGLSTYGSPARRVERVTVPGRNGDVLLDEGTFDNYIARYQIAIIDNFKVNARAIANWLLSSRGYSELTDTYNPETYRMASFYSNIDYVVTALAREGTATIEFDCKPQRYFYDNAPITFTANAYNGTIEDGNIPNTAEAPLELTLKGNTAQDGTPTPSAPIAVQSVSGDNVVTVCGKNLLGLVEGTYTNNGVTAKVNGGVVYISGTGTTSVSLIYIPLILPIPQSVGTIAKTQNPIGTYTGLQTSLRDRNHNSVAVWSNNGANTYTSLTGTAVEFLIQVNVGTTVNCTIMPMIEEGNTYSAYEPYTAQEYPINLPVENYFDINTVFADTSHFTINGNSVSGLQTEFASTVNRVYIPGALVGKQLTFQAYITAPQVTQDYYVITQANVGGTSTSGTRIYSGTNGLSYLTFTPTSTSDYVWIPSSVNAGATLTISNIMLSIGGLNTYQPYGTTPIELNKIGSYADYFHNDGGTWYLHKASSEYTITASSGASTSAGTGYYGGYYSMSSLMPNLRTVGYCRELTPIITPSGATQEGITFGAGTNNKTVFFVLNASRLTESSKAGIDAWLSANPLHIMYVLQTPTEVEVTDTTLLGQLNAISQAMSYNGTTNILQDNNDLPFNLDVTAMTSGTLTAEHNAEPIITVNSTGSLYVNGNYLKVFSAPITINSKTMQAYSGNVLKNNDVEGDFPLFVEGDNEISSDVDLTIIPNYWEL